MKKLSPRRRAFVNEYMKDKNATRAARDAGYVARRCFVRVGRKVLYRRQGGDEFRLEGVNYHAVWERDIVAVMGE